MLGEVGNNQPALAARRQMRRQPAEETTQHARIRVIDGELDRRTRLRRHPRRVAHDQRRPAIGKKIGGDDLDRCGQPEISGIFRGACERPRILVGGDHAPDAAPRQYGGQDAGAGADVESQLAIRRQRRLRHQPDILAAHRRKDAEMRVNPPFDRRHRNPLLAPLVRADQRQQAAQRNQRILAARPQSLQTGCRDLLPAPQGYAVVGGQRHQQAAEDRRSPPLRLAMPVKSLGRRRRLLPRPLTRRPIHPPRQRLQQVARILVIPAPENRRPLRRQPASRVGLQRVIGDDDRFRRRHPGLGTPAGDLFDAGFLPADDGIWGGDHAA